MTDEPPPIFVEARVVQLAKGSHRERFLWTKLCVCRSKRLALLSLLRLQLAIPSHFLELSLSQLCVTEETHGEGQQHHSELRATVRYTPST